MDYGLSCEGFRDSSSGTLTGHSGPGRTLVSDLQAQGERGHATFHSAGSGPLKLRVNTVARVK